MKTRRCSWCGAFVSHAQPLTAWKVKVGEGVRQTQDSEWNYWVKLLCNECRASVGNLVWIRVSIMEAVIERGTNVFSDVREWPRYY